MSPKSRYFEEANLLAQAIDIAVESFKRHPPHGWQDSHVEHVIKVYLKFQENALTPEPQFKNMRSFKYVVEDVFTYFQEGKGAAVNYFWEEIRKKNLPYQREDKMAKIFTAGKIKDDIQYNFVIDCIVPYQEEGLINEEQVILLNRYLREFEMKHKKSN